MEKMTTKLMLDIENTKNSISNISIMLRIYYQDKKNIRKILKTKNKIDDFLSMYTDLALDIAIKAQQKEVVRWLKKTN